MHPKTEQISNMGGLNSNMGHHDTAYVFIPGVMAYLAVISLNSYESKLYGR